MNDDLSVGDATPICFDEACRRPIHGVVVWLGETYGGVEHVWPFHPHCADQPWPLYEVRRTTSLL